MEGFSSPENFIDWGFYYLITASLQRRVWVGPDHSPLFPNIYVLLVGPAGVGKGLVIKQIEVILKYHKLDIDKLKKKLGERTSTAEDKEVAEDTAKNDYKNAQQAESGGDEKKGKIAEKPLLIPIAPDATTYEALVRALARSFRRINYQKLDEKTQQQVMGYYTHSSLSFCLEEVSSLFRKNQENVVHFLIRTYDCGDYKYETKTQGIDKISKCCLNILGGTTPAFMQNVFDDQLLTEGFSSRTFFIYAPQNRKCSLWIPDLNEQQKQYQKDLIDHVEKLTELHGRAYIDKDTEEWLEQWWKDSQLKRPNTSYKLDAYYARKNIHVLKIAMALHFGESTEMKISRETIERAISILAKEEKNMHFALGFDKANPLASVANKIEKSLHHAGKKTFKQILMEFWNALPQPAEENLKTVIEFLIYANRIAKVDGKMGDVPAIFYDVMRQSAT